MSMLIALFPLCVARSFFSVCSSCVRLSFFPSVCTEAPPGEPLRAWNRLSCPRSRAALCVQPPSTIGPSAIGPSIIGPSVIRLVGCAHMPLPSFLSHHSQRWRGRPPRRLDVPELPRQRLRFQDQLLQVRHPEARRPRRLPRWRRLRWWRRLRRRWRPRRPPRRLDVPELPRQRLRLQGAAPNECRTSSCCVPQSVPGAFCASRARRFYAAIGLSSFKDRL